MPRFWVREETQGRCSFRRSPLDGARVEPEVARSLPVSGSESEWERGVDTASQGGRCRRLLELCQISFSVELFASVAEGHGCRLRAHLSAALCKFGEKGGRRGEREMFSREGTLVKRRVGDIRDKWGTTSGGKEILFTLFAERAKKYIHTSRLNRPLD